MKSFRVRWLWVLLAVGLVLAVLWLWSIRGPRFQGHGVSYWFPRWKKTYLDSNRVAYAEQREEGIRRTRLLTNAGPELMPLLEAAFDVGDVSWAMRYEILRKRLPRRIAEVLPERDSPNDDLTSAWWVTTQWIRNRPENLRALTNAWPRLSVWSQSSVLATFASESFGQSEELTAIAEPWLLPQLASTEPTIVWSAGVSLLQCPVARTPALSNIVAALARAPVQFNTYYLPETLIGMNAAGIRLAALGTNAAVAVPWLRSWLERGMSSSATAIAVLPIIAPDSYQLGPLLRQELPRLGCVGMGSFSGILSASTVRSRLNLSEIVPVLVPLLDRVEADRYVRQWSANLPHSALSGSFWIDYLQTRVLGAIGQAGRDAASAAKPVAALLTSKDSSLSRAAAVCLARIGPLTPDTIAEIKAALPNHDAAPALVLLLAAYGSTARAAVSVLRALENGSLLVKVEVPSVDSEQRLASQVIVEPEVARQVSLLSYWPGAPVGTPDDLPLATRDELLSSDTCFGSRDDNALQGFKPVCLAELIRSALLRIEASTNSPAP